MELNTPGGRRGEGHLVGPETEAPKEKDLVKKVEGSASVFIFQAVSRPFPGHFKAASRLFTAGTVMFSNLLKLQMLRGLLVVALLQEGQRG